MSADKARPQASGEGVQATASVPYRAPAALGTRIANLQSTRATGFHHGGLLFVAEGANPDAALQLAFGCLDYVRERLGQVIGNDPMTDAEAWVLELLVDTALAAYAACGAEG